MNISKKFFGKEISLELYNTLDFMINFLPKLELSYEWSQEPKHCFQDFSSIPTKEVDGDLVFIDDDYFPCDYCSCKNKKRKYKIQISWFVYTLSINWN